MMAWRRSIAPKISGLAMWAAKPGPRSLPILLFSSWQPARTFPSRPKLLTRKFYELRQRALAEGRLVPDCGHRFWLARNFAESQSHTFGHGRSPPGDGASRPQHSGGGGKGKAAVRLRAWRYHAPLSAQDS